MKNVILVVMVVLFTTFSIIAEASNNDGEKVDSKKEQTFSAEEKLKAQEQMKELGKLFGITSPEPVVVEKKEKTDTVATKTLAEVSDKALDMIGNTIAQIAEQIQKVAPKIWEVMVKQQYAKAIAGLVTPFLVFFITLFAAILTRKSWKLDEVDEKDDIFSKDTIFTERGFRAFVTFFIPLIVCTFAALSFSSSLSDSVLYLINPEYYAVRDLVKLLLAPASM